ncbi:LytR/AlgR family response regulator transcription factor [Konateibacter massiliensis]|uniref:LytR/AlgR family response regulator transcription factor n=1 Tax=Konateibacter massiliensis TaxID=2002841 RepID=UPI000C15E90E|nr:LytTR family DNA-binding domain-containing protein [Konateibacter massiliensis]
MYQAAIVEDEPEILDYLKHTLSDYFRQKNFPVAFDAFLKGTGFLDMFDNHYHYDMIFLDIEMPGIDGIDICRHIRSIAPDTLVVFISNKEELVFQTFEVQPFRFIRKSEYQQLLPSLVDSLISQLLSKQSSLIYITEALSGDIFSFDVNQIVYIEAQRKSCCITTTTGNTILRCKLMDLDRELSKFHFIKPHRSYLVNCRYIFHIGKTSIRLSNQQEVPISRNRIEKVKQEFLFYHTN